MSIATPTLPTLFIPHGGGPCFFMGADDGMPPGIWDRMGAYLRGLAASLPAPPRAALVISGHWEQRRATVNVAPHPTLLYDYYGFPPHTYQLTYPAPGSPPLAARVRELLSAAGIESAEESARGLDHGVFIPFKLIFPQAELPVVQLSLLEGLDPAAHLALGAALAPLRNEGVLIVGSGMSYHNLREFFSPSPASADAADNFDRWLTDTVQQPDAGERARRLQDWAQAPGARACHPRAEHLLPLMVVAGAAGTDAGVRNYGERVLGKAQSGFRFG